MSSHEPTSPDLFKFCLRTQDLSENKKLRQGKQTTHEIYGVPHTISSTLYGTLALYSMRDYEVKITFHDP